MDSRHEERCCRVVPLSGTVVGWVGGTERTGLRWGELESISRARHIAHRREIDAGKPSDHGNKVDKVQTHSNRRMGQRAVKRGRCDVGDADRLDDGTWRRRRARHRSA